MAYINQTQNPRRRAAAIAGVVAVHTALALALLSMSVVGDKEIVKTWDPFTLTPEPKPTPPPTPQTTPETSDPVIITPEQPFDSLKPVDEVVVETVTFDDGLRVDDTQIVRPPPTPTPRPSPSFTPKNAVPVNRPPSWITTEDYPAQPLRNEIEGVASYGLIVSSGGRVSSCEITRSTGNRALDDATCRLISSRARFQAATDENGASVVGSYTGKVRWEIPGQGRR